MDWAEEYGGGTPNAFGGGLETKDSFRLIPLTNIPLTRLRRSGQDGQDGGQALPVGTAQRAHLRILAQRAEIVQAMVATFFITRNPRKH
jgi:hypothetical protein